MGRSCEFVESWAMDDNRRYSDVVHRTVGDGNCVGGGESGNLAREKSGSLREAIGLQVLGRSKDAAGSGGH